MNKIEEVANKYSKAPVKAKTPPLTPVSPNFSSNLISNLKKKKSQLETISNNETTDKINKNFIKLLEVVFLMNLGSKFMNMFKVLNKEKSI